MHTINRLPPVSSHIMIIPKPHILTHKQSHRKTFFLIEKTQKKHCCSVVLSVTQFCLLVVRLTHFKNPYIPDPGKQIHGAYALPGDHMNTHVRNIKEKSTIFPLYMFLPSDLLFFSHIKKLHKT